MGLIAFLACGGGGGSGGGDHSSDGSGGSGGSGGSYSNGGSGGSSGNGGSGGTAGNGGSGASGSGGSGGSSSATSSSTSSGGTGGSEGGLAYPLWLTRIGNPNAQTAHVSLYFTVTDALQEPVPGLVTEDFIAKENGTGLDPFESAFRVGNPTGRLVIPTVLLLDLSRSVIEAGALDELKNAAGTIIDSLDDAQELAILTFASDVTTRATFTKDKPMLHAAIDAITDADGISTNLYGSLQQAYGMWSDGFYTYSDTEPQLVAGMVIAVSDGNDTAGIATLEQVVSTRGTKRTIFIRVGDDLDRNVAGQIANAGVIDAAGGFDELDSAVEEVTQRVGRLNEAIYIAEYCSPKRANQHELFFTVDGNEDYLDDSSNASICAPSGPGPSCDGSDYYCRPNPDDPDYYMCCDPAFPYHCPGTCYATPEDAEADCGSSCVECGAGLIDEGDSGSSGPAIEISFNADGFADEQCAALFEDPEPDPDPMPADPSQACSSLQNMITSHCGEALGATVDCGIQFTAALGMCGQNNEATSCPDEAAAYWSCLSDDISGNPDYWYCYTDGPEMRVLCSDNACMTELDDLMSCMDTSAP